MGTAVLLYMEETVSVICSEDIFSSWFRPVVFNLGYSYPREYAKAS
jgi:hypothetical protein